MPRKIIAFIISFCLIFEQSGFAQIIGTLGVPAYLNRFAPVADAFHPVHLRALTVQPQTNNFDLLLDKGDSKDLKPSQIKSNAQQLLEYFRIGLVLPNSAFWVNLRPDAPQDIIDPEVGKTDIGRIFLEADVQLKKDMARFTSPETPEGREYWDKLYEKAEEIFGPVDVSIPTITRPWIVPGEIIIGEAKGGAYIYKATLKVMLEQDYLKGSVEYSFEDERLKQLNDYSSEILRRLIIPKLTREVNAAKRYAALRQVYYSLILAQWVKGKFGGKGAQGESKTLFSKIDSGDLTGLTSQKKWTAETYYKAYQKSFKNGEYSLDESVYNAYGMTIRRYFSGGIAANAIQPFMTAVQAIPSRINESSASATITPEGEVILRSKDLISREEKEKRPSALQDGGEMKFLGEAKIGGEKQKEFWADDKGQLWIFKLNPYIAQPYRPLGVQAYYTFVQKAFPGHPALVRTADPSGKFRNGTLEKVILKKNTPPLDKAADRQAAAEYFRKYSISNLKAEINAGNLKVADLSTVQTEQVLREMVIDWLFSNHDSHPANFLIDEQGNIIGIDKEQVFKYFLDPSKDKLSLSNFPNGQSFAPLFYSVLSNLAAKGKLSMGLIDEVLKSIEAISDDEMTAIILPFAKEYSLATGITEQDFLNRFLGKKHNLQHNFEKFFAEITASYSQLAGLKVENLFTLDPQKEYVKLLDNKAALIKQFFTEDIGIKYVGPPKTFFTFLKHAVEKTPVSEKAEQEPVFRAQPALIQRLSSLYGMARGIIARLRESVLPAIIIRSLIEEYYQELLSAPSFTAAQREGLDEMKQRLIEFTRAPPEEINRLKIKFVLLAAWVGELRQRKADFHRVYLARDAGFFHLLDRLIEQEEPSASYYEAGSSVYYVSRGRMSGESTQRLYSKMKNIITEAQKSVSDKNLQALYREIRVLFRKEYAQDPQFRSMVDAVAAELKESGYDEKDKLIFVDTGFLGTIPFFLKNVLDLNKEDWELVDEAGEERIQVAIIQPSSISAFAKDLLGFDLDMFAAEDRGRIEDLARPFGEGKDLGSNLEDIRAHPVRFNEGSWEIQYTEAATQLEFFYEQIIAVLAFFERRAAIEAAAGDKPKHVRHAVSRSLISQDIKQLLEFELTKKAPQDFFAKSEYASVLKQFLDNTQLYSIDTLKIPEVVHFSFAPHNFTPMQFVLDNTIPERFSMIVKQLFKQFFNIAIGKVLTLKEAIALFRGVDADVSEEMLDSLSEENRAIVDNILAAYPKGSEQETIDKQDETQKDGGKIAQLESWLKNAVQPEAYFYHGTSLQALLGTAVANQKNAGGYRFLARNKAEELKIRIWGGEKGSFLGTIGEEYVSITGLYPIARGYAQKFSQGRNKEYMSLEAVQLAQQKARDGLKGATEGSILMKAYTQELEELGKRETYLKEIAPEELAEEMRQLSIPIVVGVSKDVLSRKRDRFTQLMEIDELNIREYIDLSEVTHIYTAQEHMQEAIDFLRAAGFAKIQVLPFEIMDLLFFSDDPRISRFRDNFVDNLWINDEFIRTDVKQSLQEAHLRRGKFSLVVGEELKEIEDTVNGVNTIGKYAAHKDGGEHVGAETRFVPAETLAWMIGNGAIAEAVQVTKSVLDLRLPISQQQLKEYAQELETYLLEVKQHISAQEEAWIEFTVLLIKQQIQAIREQQSFNETAYYALKDFILLHATESLAAQMLPYAATIVRPRAIIPQNKKNILDMLDDFERSISIEAIRKAITYAPEEISSVRQLVEQVIQQTQAEQVRVSVTVEGDAAGKTHLFFLYEMLLNFVTNGLKYYDLDKAEKMISIRIREEGKKILIDYEDNGQGMTEQEQRYFLTGEGPLPGKDGEYTFMNRTGQGARIVLSALRAMRGRYVNFSSALGIGTKFTVELDRRIDKDYHGAVAEEYATVRHDIRNLITPAISVSGYLVDEFPDSHEIADFDHGLSKINKALEEITVILEASREKIQADKETKAGADQAGRDGGDKKVIDASITALSSTATRFSAQYQAREQIIRTILNRLQPGRGNSKYFFDRETKALIEYAVEKLIVLLSSADDASILTAGSLALEEMIDIGCRCGYEGGQGPVGIEIEYALLKELFEYDREDRQRPVTEVTKKMRAKEIREAGAYLLGSMLRNKPAWDARDLAMIRSYIGLDVLHLRFDGSATNLSAPFFEGLASGLIRVQTLPPPGNFPVKKTIDRQELGEALTRVVPPGYTLVNSAGRTLIYKQTSGTKYLAFKILKKGEDIGVLEYESQMFDYISTHKKELGIPETLHFPRSFLIDGRRVVKVNVKQALNPEWPDSESSVALMAYEVDDPAYFSYVAGEGSKMNKAAFKKSLVESMNVLFTLARFGIVDTELIALFHHQADTSREDKGIYLVMVDALRALPGFDSQGSTWIRPDKRTARRNGAGSLDGYIDSTNWPNIRQHPYPLADLPTLFLISSLAEQGSPMARHMDNFEERGEVYSREVFYMGGFMGNYLLSAALLTARYFRDRDLLHWQDKQAVEELADYLKDVFASSVATFTQMPDNDHQLAALIDTVDWDRLARQISYFMAADHPYAEHLFGAPVTKEQMRELFGDALVELPQYDLGKPLPTGVIYSGGQGPQGWFSAEKKGEPSLGPFNGPLPLQELVTAIYLANSYMLYTNNKAASLLPAVSRSPRTQQQDGGRQTRLSDFFDLGVEEGGLRGYIKSQVPGHQIVEIDVAAISKAKMFAVIKKAVEDQKAFELNFQGLERKFKTNYERYTDIIEKFAYLIDGDQAAGEKGFGFQEGYPLVELLKNAFYHGSKLYFEHPIYAYVELGQDGRIKKIVAYDYAVDRPRDPIREKQASNEFGGERLGLDRLTEMGWTTRIKPLDIKYARGTEASAEMAPAHKDGGVLSTELQETLVENNIVAVFSKKDSGLELVWRWQDYEKQTVRKLSRPQLLDKDDRVLSSIQLAISSPQYPVYLPTESPVLTSPDREKNIRTAAYRVISDGTFVLLAEEREQTVSKNEIFAQLYTQMRPLVMQRKASSFADGGVDDIADVIPAWGKFAVVNHDKETIAEFFRDRIANKRIIAVYFSTEAGAPDKEMVLAVAALAAEFDRDNRDIHNILSKRNENIFRDWLVLVNGKFVAMYGNQARTFSSKEYPDAKPADIARLIAKDDFRGIRASAYVEDLITERDAITPLEFWAGTALDGGKKSEAPLSKQRIIRDFTRLINNLERSGELTKELSGEYRSTLEILLSPSKDALGGFGFSSASIIAQQLRDMRKHLQDTRTKEPAVVPEILPALYALSRYFAGYNTNDIRAEVSTEAENLLNDITALQEEGAAAVAIAPNGAALSRVDAASENNKDGGKGGIDLRSLPIAIQPAVNPAPGGIPAGLPAVNIADLDKEWQQIQMQIQDEAMPYARIKEYVVSCKQQQAKGRLDAVLACIADILRLEEERAIATAPELKEILVTIG